MYVWWVAGCLGWISWLAGGLERVQESVDAGHQVLALSGEALVVLHVGLLLHLAGHQTLGLLGRPAHQVLHLAVQLLHLRHLSRQETK